MREVPPAGGLLRVLLVAHGHPELAPAGAEIVAYELFKALREVEGVKPFFVGRAHDQYKGERFEYYSGKCDELLIRTEPGDMFTFSHAGSDLHRDFSFLLNLIKPDVIHFHHYVNLGIELLRICKETCPDARLILTLHEFFAICHNNGQMVKRFASGLCTQASPASCAQCFPDFGPADFTRRERFIKAHFAFVDVFIAPSHFLRARYATWGLDPARIVVIENGTALSRCPDDRPQGVRGTRFGFFGQVTPYKGVIQLMQAFALIAHDERLSRSKAVLRIHAAYLALNSDALQQAVHVLLRRAEGRIEIQGRYTRNELPALMCAVDWVVVPSIWWENSPLVIEEALICRRPVICSNIGGMAEKIRDGLDGFHFPVGDHVSLAELVVAVSSEEKIWNRLQRTMRPARTVAEVARGHLNVYIETR
jgi:glycosyltransferase involved in cell wall biosynthesis